MKMSVIAPWQDSSFTLAQAKSILTISHDHLDSKIQRNARSAVALVEAVGRVSLFTQTRRISFELTGDYPDNVTRKGVTLYRGPVSSIVSVSVRRASEQPVLLDAQAYRLEEDILELGDRFPFSGYDYLTVDYIAGLPDANQLAVQHAALYEALAATLATIFDTDVISEESVSQGTRQLLAPYWKSPTYRE